VSSWRKVTLENVAVIERSTIQPEAISQGTAYVGLEHIESGGAILGAKKVEEGELASSKFKFTECHLLYGKLRPYLAKIACPDFSGICSTDILPILPGPELERRFLCYFLRQPSMVEHANSRAVGANLPRLSPSALAEFEIPLPPVVEQRRIAEVLDRAEALRAKRRAALAQLDSLTQSLFLDLFGDPATNPKGWPKATLADVTEMATGYPFRSEEYVTSRDSVRLCRGANILPGRIDWRDLARWPASKKAELADFNLKAGDVVIAMDRPWISEGFKIAQVQPEDCPALLVQRVARLRGRNEMPNEYLFHLLNQPAFTRHCRPTETTIPHISPKDIRSFAFPVPPIELRREFARRVTAVEKLKTAQRASLAELDALFATLQHRAFRGEL